MYPRPVVPLWLCLLVSIIIAGGMAYRGYTREAAANARTEAVQAELAKAQAQVKSLRNGVARASREAQAARLELQDALKQNPGWATEPVPAAVADSLCKRIRCASPAGSVPAPAR